MTSWPFFQAGRDIACMIFTGFDSKLQIGTQERGSEFGDQFLDRVTFAPEFMPPKSRSSRVLLPAQWVHSELLGRGER